MAIDFKAESIDKSPLDRPRMQQGIEFDYNTDRNAVGRTKIKNFSFSQGNGGTIILGGTANGDGLMLVKDASGNTIVTVDNAGIEVEGGNIVVKNADNTTIIDTSGIVSSANFPSDFVTDNTLNSESGTAYVDVPGSSLDAFVIARPTKALILTSLKGYNPYFVSDDSSLSVAVNSSVSGDIMSRELTTNWYLTGIDQDINEHITGWSITATSIDSTFGNIVDLAAGTHTLKLRYKRNGASGTAFLENFQLSYVVLGA